MVTHAFNPSTPEESEAGWSLILRPAWSVEPVPLYPVWTSLQDSQGYTVKAMGEGGPEGRTNTSEALQGNGGEKGANNKKASCSKHPNESYLSAWWTCTL